MEDFAAGGEHPAQLSAKNIAGCHLCIAIIAFQRGTISTIDNKGRSITQVEMDTAKEMGIGVLPFLLTDSESNRQLWPAEYNDLKNKAVQEWRREYETTSTCEYFDANEMPDVLPAVSRQITKWEHQRSVRLQIALASVAGVVIAISLLFAVSPSSRQWLLSHILAYHDPVVFQHSSDGTYKVARLLEGRSDINDNTKMIADIASAKVSFEMFANTFGLFREYQRDFEAAASRGVRLRFVMTDFANENRPNWQAFQDATEPTSEAVTETLSNAANIRQMIDLLTKKYPNKVEYRLNKRPLFYTLWVRDPDQANGMAHLGMFFYGQVSKTNWPAIRVSPATGGGEFRILKEQFETIWKDAVKPSNVN